MMTMINLISLVTLVTYFTQIQRTIGYTIQSKVDCSEYISDTDILSSFLFIAQLNPENQNAGTTFAEKNKNGHVISLKIVNQKCVPSLTFCFKHLFKLEIVNTSFCHSEGRLPPAIARLAGSLTDLHIHDTHISHLPNEINRLKRLQILVLANTGLRSLPDSVGDLVLVKFLILPDNNLSALPKTIRKLRSLIQLTLTNNRRLQSIKSLNGHLTLQILDTRQCPIQLLPQNLPQLFFLHMSNNKLTHLNGIHSLGTATTKRKTFQFDRNAIQAISPRIRHVHNLSQLNLAHNQLVVLPTDIFNIPTLSVLNIKSNHFPPGDIPKYISKFNHTNPNLKLLHD